MDPCPTSIGTRAGEGERATVLFDERTIRTGNAARKCGTVGCTDGQRLVTKRDCSCAVQIADGGACSRKAANVEHSARINCHFAAGMERALADQFKRAARNGSPAGIAVRPGQPDYAIGRCNGNLAARSEEGRGGKEGVSTCRTRWSTYK